MDIRNLLNERKWRQADLSSLSLVVRHRGAPEDERRISGGSILEIAAAGVFVEARDAEGEPIDDGRAFIPYHRFLRVTGPEGLLFERKEAP